MGTLERIYAIGIGGMAVAGIVRLAGNISSKEAAKLKSDDTLKAMFETAEETDTRHVDAASLETLANVLQWSSLAVLIATALVAAQVLRRPRTKTISS